MSRGEITDTLRRNRRLRGVETFLDTPVKRYSSGMYVRLAFAVAAHLEPEILIVDEVLAVGDAEFQKKCLGKISDVAQSGRTVLFVSHNMAAVEGLCARTLLLQSGNVVLDGESQKVIAQDSDVQSELSYDLDLRDHAHRVIHVEPVLRRLRLTNAAGELLRSIPLGEPLCFEIRLNCSHLLRAISIGIHIYDSLGHRVLTFHSRYQMTETIALDGPTLVRCNAESCRLMPGRYSVVIGVASGNQQIDRIEPCGAFEVVERDVFRTGRLPSPRDGVFVCWAEWSATAVADQDAHSLVSA